MFHILKKEWTTQSSAKPDVTSKICFFKDVMLFNIQLVLYHWNLLLNKRFPLIQIAFLYFRVNCGEDDDSNVNLWKMGVFGIM